MDEKEKFLIIDDTQDRKYFTIVPNLVDEKYNALIVGVYLHIKRKAGETGQYFETQLNACKKLKITSPTLREIYKKLEKDGFIEKIGTKVLKTKPVNVYKVVDVWLKNTEEIEKRYGKKNTTSILNKKDVEKPALLDVEKRELQGRTDIKEKPKICGEQRSPIFILRSYFTDRCKKLKGFEPEMSFGKEGKLLKEKLRRFSVDQLKDLIDKFFNSQIGKNLGYTLSICLSAATINQWLANSLETPKKPFYKGNPMVQKNGRWYVIENGEWLEFAGSTKDIIFK